METRELVREVPGEGRRGRSAANAEEDEEDEERSRRERRVEADTLGNLYNYPQGRPEAAGGGTWGG